MAGKRFARVSETQSIPEIVDKALGSLGFGRRNEPEPEVFENPYANLLSSQNQRTAQMNASMIRGGNTYESPYGSGGYDQQPTEDYNFNWEQIMGAETYEQPRMASKKHTHWTEYDLNSSAINRVSDNANGGGRRGPDVRPNPKDFSADPWGSSGITPLENVSLASMMAQGPSIWDADFSRLTHSFQCRDLMLRQEKADRFRLENKKAAENAARRKTTLREYQQASDRMTPLSSSAQITRASSRGSVVDSRFGMYDWNAISDREEQRLDSARARMERTAGIKAKDHKIQAQKHHDWELENLLNPRGASMMSDYSGVDRLLNAMHPNYF
jgi:hypothetical protein